MSAWSTGFQLTIWFCYRFQVVLLTYQGSPSVHNMLYLTSPSCCGSLCCLLLMSVSVLRLPSMRLDNSNFGYGKELFTRLCFPCGLSICIFSYFPFTADLRLCFRIHVCKTFVSTLGTYIIHLLVMQKLNIIYKRNLR